jgi:hypothetical protein
MLTPAAYAGNEAHVDDPHYTPSGFFDIHVCHWPERPPFYMALYRTERIKDIESVIIKGANGKILGELDTANYKTRKHKNKPLQKMLLDQIPIPDDKIDGWFVAEVQLKNGERHVAKDMVIHQYLQLVSGNYPEPGAEDIPMPKMMHWYDVDGAYWYKVFIRDMWDDEKLIYSSTLLPFPEHELPEGVLEPGGFYSWKVQARDAKYDIELGEFNAGSQSRWIEFSVSDD